MKLLRSGILRCVCGLVIALAIACTGCSDSVRGLANRTRKAATADAWRAWAAQVVERSRTNSMPPPPAEWPEFVRRTAVGNRTWRVVVSQSGSDTYVTPLVMLISLGGFQSIGVVIGPPEYVEIAPSQYPQISRAVYAGIYVREVH